MPDFRSEEEEVSFYMVLSEGKGTAWLDYRLQHMTEEQQQAKLDQLRRFRIETGRQNP